MNDKPPGLNPDLKFLRDIFGPSDNTRETITRFISDPKNIKLVKEYTENKQESKSVDKTKNDGKDESVDEGKDESVEGKDETVEDNIPTCRYRDCTSDCRADGDEYWRYCTNHLTYILHNEIEETHYIDYEAVCSISCIQIIDQLWQDLCNYWESSKIKND